MAIIDEGGGSNAQGSVSSSSTSTFTVTSGNLLICGVAYTDSGSLVPTSVVWDAAGLNQAFTLLKRQRESVNTGLAVDIWYRKAPTAATSKSVTVTLNSTTGVGICARSLTGVDQTTTFRDVTTTGGTADSESGASDPITVTLSSAVNDLVFDIATAPSASTQNASQTQKFASVASGIFTGASTKPGASSITMSWTKDGGGTQHWAQAAVSIIPSGAAVAAQSGRALLLGVGG